jgi:hypothetical protein
MLGRVRDCRGRAGRELGNGGLTLPIDRVKCSACDHMILPETAAANAGLCGPCARHLKMLRADRPNVSIHREIGKIEIWWEDVPFDQLPSDIRAVLTEDEAAAYITGPSYFRTRAAYAHYAPMTNLLLMLGEEKSMTVRLYGGMPQECQAFFGVRVGPHLYYQLRLPSKLPLPGEPPDEIVRLYRDMGGLI